MERPHRIEVVQYAPEALHTLRLYFGGRVEERVVNGPNAVIPTSTNDARAWLADELDVRDDDYD